MLVTFLIKKAAGTNVLWQRRGKGKSKHVRKIMFFNSKITRILRTGS